MTAGKHLHRAVRALAGLDDPALDAVTPEAMRSVLMRRGWKHVSSRTAASGVIYETWDHSTARHAGLHGIRSVRVPTSAAELHGARVQEWAESLAERHGNVTPAELIAEALAWWDAP